jgi:hypothetical protein
MKIDVKVYGKVQKVTQSEYAVQILGKIDTVSLSTKYCDQEKVFFFQNPYQGIIIEGADLKVKNFENSKVLVNGVIFSLKFLDENGETVKTYNVNACCINVTEVPEEEPEEDYDEDLFDELD